MKVNFKVVRSWSGRNPDGKDFWCFIGDTVDVQLYNTQTLPKDVRTHCHNGIVRLKLTNIKEGQIKGILVYPGEDKKEQNTQLIIKPEDIISVKVVRFLQQDTEYLSKKEIVS